MVSWTQADVVVMTAIELEYQAVLAVEAGAAPGSRWEEEEHHGLPVARRELVGKGGAPLRVVVGRAPDMGAGMAIAVLGPLVDALRPAVIAMCGVCAGRPGKTALGDVVAGERLFAYDTGKDKGAMFEADLRTYSLPAPWKVALERFKPVARFGGEAWWRARPVPYEWQEWWVLAQLRAGVADPRDLPESTARCPQWTAVIGNLWDSKDVERGTLVLTAKGRERADAVAVLHREFPDLSPAGTVMPFQLHVAPIGSGSAVVENEEVWGFVSSHMRKALAIEMEANGLADLVRSRAHRERIEAVVMKGVMDFANHGRDDHFKEYAARASAECLLAFLREQLPAAARVAEAGGGGGGEQAPPASAAGGPSSGASSSAAGDAAAAAGARAGARAASGPVELYDRLSRLTDTLFEDIAFRAKVTRGLMPAKNSPLTERVIALAELAALDRDLARRLGEQLDQHAPWTR